MADDKQGSWSVTDLKGVLDLFRSQEQEPAEPTTPTQQVDDNVEKLEAAKGEVDLLKAQLAELEAERGRAKRVAEYAASFKEFPALVEDADAHELLADLPEDVAEKVMTKFKALSAQIAESELTGTIGGNDNEDANPIKTFHSAIEKVANERGISYNDAVKIAAVEYPKEFLDWGGRA
jgi:chromosome condensin MukBEF ATPase and DNA-binding subunit MukB